MYSINLKTCRVCLVEPADEKCSSTYLEFSKDEDLKQKFKAITGIQLTPEDPDKICPQCKVKLNMAYAFRQNALSTHKYLRKFIAKSKSIFEDMKKSVKLVEVYEDYEFLDSEIQEQPKEPASKSEQHLKQEELIIDEVTEPEYELAEVVEEVNIADQEMAENVITDQYFDEIYEVEEEVLESNQETAESLVTEEIEEIIEDDDLFNEDTKSTLGNRDKDMSMSDSDGGILQCDECQKQFKTKTNLKVHKKLHTGDKPFACEYCQKRFATKGVLKQHVYIHTAKSHINVNTVTEVLHKARVWWLTREDTLAKNHIHVHIVNFILGLETL
uniref:C2H2-type domain-containing protein n=1 Tax=Megaselia scalaris TaxID=36166 RepID=T1GFY6_MEGSC